MKARLIQALNLGLLLAASRLSADDTTNTAPATNATPVTNTNAPASSIVASNSAAAIPGAPAPTNDVVKLDFPSFQIISQRNIFDPSRRPRRNSIDPRQLIRPAQVDYFTLRGTSSYDDQKVAVFVGNNSLYNKMATNKDTIAGYKIAEIDFDHVKLAAASNATFNLPIGSQMKRTDNGPWVMADVSDYSAEPVRAPSTEDKPATNADSGKPGGGGSSADDVIQRLMRKREQEK